MRTLFIALLLIAIPVHAARYAELDEARIAAIAPLLPAFPRGIGADCANRTVWDQPALALRLSALTQEAEKLLTRPFPAWDDNAYLEYSRNGSRPNGERMMNARKAWLYPLVIAECLENKARFLPAIEHTLIELDTQPTWTWAAHDKRLRNFKNQDYEVDLLAADMANDIAQALYLLGDALSPAVRQKTQAALEERIFAPLRRSFATGNKDNWWLHADHNWNAVCLKGTVAAALAALPDRQDRALFAAAGEHYIRHFLAGFPTDGYSTEGPGYWNYGFSHFTELREVLMQATGNRFDLFADSKVRNIALYGARIEMLPGNIAAFSDANAKEKIDAFTLAYSNEAFELGLPLKLSTVPISTKPGGNSAPLSVTAMQLFSHPYVIASQTEALDPLRSYFDQVGVLVTRPAPGDGSRLAASIKSGGNANHSHNDIGSYTIALGNEQPTGDVGRPVYSSKTFSKARYTIKAINSYGHPVPVVAGELQREATKVKPKVLATRFTADADEITLDLAPAYNVWSLKALTRTLRHERANGGTITIEDRFEYTSAQTFETALTTLGNWQRRPDGTLELWQKNEHLHVRIEASAPYEVSAEKIDEEGLAFTRIAIRLKEQQQAGWVKVAMQAM
ncbi:MAG: hypothetical protein P4L87_17765 [Formivibrio sp.]|nr:hypothetical protein [Formivibrio sp.]